MTSYGTERGPSAREPWDLGLLTPVSAGSAAEAATGDTAFLQAMLDAEAALTRAQAALGLAPAAAARAVTDAARAERYAAREIALRARGGGNPVIPLVAELTAAVGADAAPYVHRGATSQDIVDTALMLMARRTLGLVLADLDRVAAALAALAAEHRDTPMAGRTLTQQAVPTTFGLKAAGWRSVVLDARDRVARVRGSLPAELGGAAGTLAAFGEFAGDSQLQPPQGREADPHEAGHATTQGRGAAPCAAPPRGREEPCTSAEGWSRSSPRPSDGATSPSADPSDLRGHPRSSSRPGNVPGDPSASASRPWGVQLIDVFADEVGLVAPGVPWHALRTPVADLGAVLGFTAAALGRLAEDVLVLSRTEVRELAEGSGGGSSAMPHKSNPVRATLVAATARQVPPLAGLLLASLAASDERPAGPWHAEWQTLRTALRLVGGAARDAAELAEGLRVDPARMRANLDLTGGAVVSERLSAVLAARLGRAEAKQLLTRASRRAAAEGTPLAEALDAEDALPDDLRKDLPGLLDPAQYLGAAPALVDRALRSRPSPGSKESAP